MTTPLLAADVILGGASPPVREIAAFASERGARFLALGVEDGDDETPQALCDGGRVAGLAKAWEEARRHHLGLLLRLMDTLSIAGLREALGVEKGTSPAKLRGTILVVVADDRTGKRLRREAPEFPSALELRPKGSHVRGLMRFVPPMGQRAAADAEDLIVPWSRADDPRIASKWAPGLARRGSRLWISDVPQADAERASRLPATGLVVRFAFGSGVVTMPR